MPSVRLSITCLRVLASLVTLASHTNSVNLWQRGLVSILNSFSQIIFCESANFGLSIIHFRFLVAEDRRDPCSPSPCGPNSRCQVVNDQAVCTCLPEYTGSPPGCRPECVVSSECPPNLACVNQKCTNPCPGTCGLGADCNVIHHSPICACRPKYTGNPFTRCSPMIGENSPPRSESVFQD